MTARIVEAIDRLEYRAFCLTTRGPTITPDQLGLDGFEERLDYGDDLDAILAHQTSDPTMAHLHSQFLQFLGHARPPIALQV